MSASLDVALWLAGHGMHVFPLRPNSKRPFGNCPRCKAGQCQPAECPCLTADRPCHGLLAATLDAAQIRRWLIRHPGANVGINTELSDLVALDLDRKPKPAGSAAHDVPTLVTDGLAALDAITGVEGVPWPDTLTIATPSDGRHLVFQRPDDLRVTSDAKGRVGHQIDIRAIGGYIVAPGGQVTSPPEDVTGTYTRVSTTTAIAPLPDWLRPRVTPPPRIVEPVNRGRFAGLQPGSHAPGYWQQVWDGEMSKVETRDGERWRLVYNAARRLANLTVHDHAPWSETEVIDALTVAAVRRRLRTGKPVEEAAARRNAARGWQRGTQDGPDSLRGLGGAA
ncbi:Bifunctional DNA primase/polymerase, N-terminal [Saccharopolyspora shandongensis]|uniref:Bifunctional DNA primase/polymerase, N-terminal n=1 Tax=Saccharopolyspora shandongensis TaxID=418495 RepID=A0A1H3LGB3_9PSEU|nr:bifunctional DNA primase/polymerase [Saccharopolyspora shandongensis]SDY63587.1 Bifunctional DNA primase/polymerase, N-terminal [Saccharopolyspora shandongensis]